MNAKVRKKEERYRNVRKSRMNEEKPLMNERNKIINNTLFSLSDLYFSSSGKCAHGKKYSFQFKIVSQSFVQFVAIILTRSHRPIFVKLWETFYM